jgi:hypothetical protein
MRRRVGSFVVRAEVGFNLNDSPSEELALFCSSDKDLAEEKRRDPFGRQIEEGAGEEPAGRPVAIHELASELSFRQPAVP